MNTISNKILFLLFTLTFFVIFDNALATYKSKYIFIYTKQIFRFGILECLFKVDLIIL